MNCPACEHPNVEGARYCAKCGIPLPSGPAEGDADPLIGQTIAHRYTIKKLLGEGGMGRVYEGEKSSAGVTQRVAIKTLHTELSRDPQVVARFHREFKTVAGLRHPSTIKVEEFGTTPPPDEALFIAMEFVEGKSVAKILEDEGAMTPERVEHIMSQVCGSLAEAHKQGVIHRDLKPDNVVLMNVGDETDFVKVLDFGIAARKDATDAAKEQKLTQQGMVLGTPPYMSPEQFMGKELDARSDIYSLGVMTYEMLTGRLPFEANTPWEWATKHMTSQPTPFEAIPERTTLPDIPGKMKNAIYRALSKKPEDRHNTVREFFDDLSAGGSRMSRVQVDPGAAPLTAVMTPMPSPAPGNGATAVNSIPGAPVDPAYQTAPQTAAPAPAAVPTPMPIPSPVGPVPGTPETGSSGGGSKTPLIIGGSALVGLIIMVGLFFAFKGGSKAAATADPTTTTSSTAPTTTTTTTTTTPTTTTTTTATAVSKGDSAGAAAVRACCGAIAAANAKGPNKGKYGGASSTCYSHADMVEKGTASRAAALTAIRASAGGTPLPGGCNLCAQLTRRV